MRAIERQVLSSPRRYATPEGQVALGRFFLLRGADPKKVLDQFYDVAIKRDARLRRRLPRHGRAGPRQARLRPGRGDPAEGPQGSRRGPAVPLPAGPGVRRRRPGPGRPRRWPRRSRSTPATSTACCCRADGLIDSERYADAAQGARRRSSRSTLASLGPGPTARCWPTCAVTATGRPRRGGSALAPWADESRGRPR